MLHHVALCCSDLAVGVEFYDQVLSVLGYRRTLLDSPRLAVWSGTEPEILLYASNAEQRCHSHATYDPGIHHLAFRVAERRIVDRVYETLECIKAHILDAPRDYPDYAPEYYAIFFCDPDGVKLEVVFAP